MQLGCQMCSLPVKYCKFLQQFFFRSQCTVEFSGQGSFTSSINVQRLDSRGIALILILEKVLNCRYDLIIGPLLLISQVIFVSCWGTENSQMVPNQENMEGDKPVQSYLYSHAKQPLQPQTLCAGALSW